MIYDDRTTLIFFIIATCLVCQGLTNRDLQASASSSSTAISRGSGNGGGAAHATSHSRSTGGHSYSKSVADASAYKKATSEIRVICARIISSIEPPNKKSHSYNRHNYCVNMLKVIEHDLKAIGSVCVQAFASAFGEVKVDGHGSACSHASATAQTTAAAFAEIMYDALLGLENGYTKKYVRNKVNVVSGVFAEVFAEASANACVSHGYAMAVQESFAKAVIQPVARLFVLVGAKIDCHDVKGYSFVHNEAASTIGVDHVEADSKGHTIVEGKGDAKAHGHADANTGKLKVCKGFDHKCCESKYKHAKKCTCSFGSFSSINLCNMKKSVDDGKMLVWENLKDGSKCMC